MSDLVSIVRDRRFANPTVKATMECLAKHADDDGTSIRPAVATVADDVGIGERQLQRILRRLQSDGLIVEARKARGHIPNVYRIDVEKLLDLPLTEVGMRRLKRRIGRGGHRAETASSRGDIMSPLNAPGVTPMSPLGVTPMSPNLSDTPKKEEEEMLTHLSCAPAPGAVAATVDADTMARAVAEWNVLAIECGLPSVRKMTQRRKIALRHRLRDAGGIEGWTIALDRIRRTPGLRGEDGGWRADFDFVLQESSFVKLMEGRYDGWGCDQDRRRHGTFGTGAGGARPAPASVAAAVRALGGSRPPRR